MLASLALFSMVPDASACGGFFCNNIEPVEQAGEHVVFEVDSVNNETTMHVQVEYQGPASEFAWVVPVNGTPELFISNDALFRFIDQVTQPQFMMSADVLGECGDYPYDAPPAPPPAAPDLNQEADGVTVLDSAQVGPYDTVTLSAQSETELVTWLQANGYAVPNVLTPALAPYVADNHNFVALRLASGNDAGDLAPLGMKYSGTDPAIPIQLTSVAATDDMQVVATILGEHRAVPTNYLHVEVNYAAIDWFSRGDNYLDVISRAADEAGGHAFATEFSGSTETLQGQFYREEWADLNLHEATGPMDFVIRVTSSGVPASQALLDALSATVPVPPEYFAQDVYNCPMCYPELDALIPFDAVAAAEQMNGAVFEPLAEIEAMFARNSVMTRLGSTVSANEMTVDPQFGFNRTMAADVSNVHQAQLVFLCDDNTEWGDRYDVPRDLILPDGTVIKIPSNPWLDAQGLTASEYLASLQEPAAVIIEETHAGDTMPTVLFDGRELVDQYIEEHNEDTTALESRAGCACNATPGAGAAMGLLALLPLLLRRRV